MLALLAKLHKWTESAMFFDGTGIGKLELARAIGDQADLRSALHTAIIIIYLTIHIQSLRTFRKPTPPLLFSSIPLHPLAPAD